VTDEADELARLAATLPMPEGVSVVFDDGTVLPLEIAYRGVDHLGMHLWVATVQLDRLPARLIVEHMPAHTAVAIERG
jgi:hypothetical protein